MLMQADLISIFATLAATFSAILALVTGIVVRRKTRVYRMASLEAIPEREQERTKFPRQVFEEKNSTKVTEADIGEDKRAYMQNNVALAAKVFEEYSDFIKAVIRYKVKNEMDVNDIFQDFFLSLVYKPIPKNVKNTKSYLYKFIIGDIIDASRRTRTYKARVSKYAEMPKYTIIRNDLQEVIVPTKEGQKALELVGRQVPRHEAESIILRYRGFGDVRKAKPLEKRAFSRYISIGLKKMRRFLSNK